MTVFAGAARVSRATGSPAREAGAPEWASMTVAQLRAACEERGIDAPRKATKAQLLGLLGV